MCLLYGCVLRVCIQCRYHPHLWRTGKITGGAEDLQKQRVACFNSWEILCSFHFKMEIIERTKLTLKLMLRCKYVCFKIRLVNQLMEI